MGASRLVILTSRVTHTSFSGAPINQPAKRSQLCTPRMGPIQLVLCGQEVQFQHAQVTKAALTSNGLHQSFLESNANLIHGSQRMARRHNFHHLCLAFMVGEQITATKSLISQDTTCRTSSLIAFRFQRISRVEIMSSVGVGMSNKAP